jgi:SpoVK/Ycf46/Vps4 family AAA+-type ATPase
LYHCHKTEKLKLLIYFKCGNCNIALKSLKLYICWGFEMHRYVSLLSEHRRIILCGPSGTGKSYLANKLAEFLVLRDGKESTAESIATFK